MIAIQLTRKKLFTAMAKQRKKKSRNKKRNSPQPKDLSLLGRAQLDKSQFSEAIKIFRQLLKTDTPASNPADAANWTALLHQAYLGRIAQLNAKGMAKESLVFYTNMVELCGQEDHELHLKLLLSSGQHSKAIAHFNSLRDTVDKGRWQAAEEILAASLLSNAGKALDFLPDDSAAKRDFTPANQALSAFCQQDDALAESLLQKIPFRSPYKNFRLALKGMLAFTTDHSKAETFFAKIAPNSPFLPWIRPYRLTADQQGAAKEKISHLERQIIQKIEGLNKTSGEFLNALLAHKGEPSKLYTLLIKHKNQFTAHQLYHICSRLLLYSPEKFTDFQRRFNIPNEFEFHRLMALAMEIERDLEEAWDEWQLAIDYLNREPSQKDQQLISAIHLHCAELLMTAGGADRRQAAVHLRESLKYSPHDREAHLLLIRACEANKTPQNRAVNEALREFPKDLEILLIGIKTAIQRGTFKKAGSLAATLLAIDPINNKARQLLIDASLEHGRKLALKAKFPAAAKEFNTAAAYDRTNLAGGRIDICRGMTMLLAKDEEDGMAAVAEGIDKAAAPIIGCFQACMEARLLKLPGKWQKIFDKKLRAAADFPADKPTLSALAALIRHCEGKRHPTLEKFRGIITPWFKRGAALRWSLDEITTLCAIFHRLNFHDLLATYAKAALKHWRSTPIFTFYHIYGKCRGGEEILSAKQEDNLYTAMQQALEQGDTKTARMIDKLMEYYDKLPLGLGVFERLIEQINEQIDETSDQLPPF